MGNRLSKIYTRTGDDGSTGLGDGERTGKDSIRVEAFGTVDELNSAIGMVVSAENNTAIKDLLLSIQHHLFDLGGELSMPGYTLLPEGRVEKLENILDEYNQDLPMLKEFILPGGGTAAAACHLARTICRRAERRVVELGRTEKVNPDAIRYLNRLSDLLFVLSRVIAREDGVGEILWDHQRNQ